MANKESYSYGYDCTIDAIGHFRSLILRSPIYQNLDSADQTFIRAQLFGTAKINNQTPMSVLESRISSLCAIRRSIHVEYEGLFASPREAYFGTFCFKKGEVQLGKPLQNVQTIINKVVCALEAESLTGLISPDIEIMQPANGAAPYLSYHLHGTVQSLQNKIRLKNTARKMAESIGWKSSLPRAVKLTGKRPGNIAFHASQMVSYQTKFTSAVKRQRLRDGEWSWERDRGRLTPKLAFYLLYGWSQLPLLGSTVAVGSFGEDLREIWHHSLKQRRRNSSGVTFDYTAREVERGWQSILQAIK